jgi:5-methylcytosine-specific restriction enzyme subunit McrC
VFALLFDMNVLWERYVATLFRRAAGPDVLVSTQERKGFWKAEGYPTRKVRPDIVVRRRSDQAVVLVADTKWKTLGDEPPADGDLKQMFVYNELLDSPRALLIYPATAAAKARHGTFAQRPKTARAGHTCATFHLGLMREGAWSHTLIEDQVRNVLRNVAPDSPTRASSAS